MSKNVADTTFKGERNSQNLIVHKSLEKVVIASSKQAIKNSITIKLQKN